MPLYIGRLSRALDVEGEIAPACSFFCTDNPAPFIMMTILFEELSESQRLGGIEAVTQELIRHLGAIGVNVVRSSEAQAQETPDCVHFHGIWSPHLARRFLTWWRLGVPCVVTPHGMLEPWALRHKRVKKWIAWHTYQRCLLNRAAALHGTSEHEVQQFSKLGLKSPAMMLPWGVSLPPRRSLPTENTRMRTALFVGRIYPVKGLPMLVEAWGRVRPSGWRLKIVGPDEAGHRAEVEMAVAKAGIADFVDFAGELTGVAKDDAFARADLLVLPSFTENFGMVVAEALAHSLPVLTTKGTPWSVLPEQECGWWVDPSVEALATALETATRLENDVLCGMGQRGRALVAKQYSWEHVAITLKQFYLSLRRVALDECF